jgi:hypothetical protein
MAIQTRGNIQRLLQEGVDAVAGARYARYNPEWKAFLEEKSDNSAYATDVYKATLGVAQLKPEGSEVFTDSAQQLYVNQYTHAVYAVGSEITYESIEDNLYENEMREAGIYIEDSLQEAEQIIAANIINNGDTSALAGDGLSVFNTAHILKSGTFANKFSAFQSLSEAALEDACIAVSSLPRS